MKPNPLRKPRWDPWPVSIITFFTIAIISCVSFVVYCNRHPADLVAADYYEQEVRYQGQIERIQHAQQRAHDASVTYDRASERINVALPSAQSGSNLVGTIQLYRPSALNQDRTLKFEPNPNGLQNIDASNLQPGLWKVRVSWVVDKQEYFIDQKVVVTRRAS